VLGRSFGRRFLLLHGGRVGVTGARLERVERLFARHGAKAIVIGRFVGVVRALGPFTAGASGMRAGRFVAADVAGAGLWAATFTGLGYLFAGNVGTLLDGMHHAQVVLAAVLVGGLAAALLVSRRRRRLGT
jgi:membrane-associated protein